MTSTPDHIPADLAEIGLDRPVPPSLEVLLAEAAAHTASAAPAPAAPSIPPGFRLVETTHPDGTVTRTFEPVAATGAGAPAAEPADLPDATLAKPGRIPAWAYSRRAQKLAAAAVALGSAGVVAAVYGPAIGAGLTAAAAGVWAAIVTAAKVVGAVALGLGVLYVLASSGSNKPRKPRTGTFEGTMRGTWRQD
ncbi:hypothetical protein [Streptomyces virginiae]|uniref:hypothetical protein n=1 Tax=Streptomyces virginiae TaxID=1961 RepID=UPI002251CE23|nr:hypothetical protein [Streptomyces virginiae]MCX5278269.1 hypothetical protein [Streptomyces virginiae]